MQEEKGQGHERCFLKGFDITAKAWCHCSGGSINDG